MEQDYMPDECGSILQQLEGRSISAKESESDNYDPSNESSSSSTSSTKPAEISKAEKLIPKQSKDNEEKENKKTSVEDDSKAKQRRANAAATKRRWRAKKKLEKQQNKDNEDNKNTSDEDDSITKQRKLKGAQAVRRFRAKEKLKKKQAKDNEDKNTSVEDDSKTKKQKLMAAAANRRWRAKKKLKKQQAKDNEDKNTSVEDDSKAKKQKLSGTEKTRRWRAKKKATAVVPSYEQFLKSEIQKADRNETKAQLYIRERAIFQKHREQFGSQPSSDPTVQKVLEKFTKQLQFKAESRRRRKVKDLQSCDQSPIASTSSPFQSHAEEIILNQSSPNIIEPCLAPFDNDDLSLGTGCNDSGSSTEGSEDFAAGQTVPETFETPTWMDHSSYSKNLQHRVKKNSSRHLKKVTSATTIGEDLLSPGTSDVDVDANPTAVTGIMAAPGKIVKKRRLGNKTFRETVSIYANPKSSASFQSPSLVSGKSPGRVSYPRGVKRFPVTNSEHSATLRSTASSSNNLPEKQNQESIMGKKRQPYITKVQYAIEHQRVLNELKAVTDNITTEVMAAIVGDPLESRIKQWPLSSTNEVSNLLKFKIKMTAELDQKELDNKNLRLLNKSLLTQLEQFRSNLKVPMEIEVGAAPGVNRISESMSLDVVNYSRNMEILELELKTLLEKRILNPLTLDEICRKYLNEYKKELDLTKFVMQSPACLADQVPGLIIEEKKELTIIH